MAGSNDGAGAAPKPTTRNALLTWLLPVLLIAAAPPLGNFLGQTWLRLAPSAAMAGGILLIFFTMQRMAAELNSVTGGKLVGWHYLIPVYGLYWALAVLPKEMAAAKQKLQRPPPRGAVIYLLVCLYAFAADLNDLT